MLLQLLTFPANADVLEYFYSASAGIRLRLPACVHHEMRTDTGDFLWYSAESMSKRHHVATPEDTSRSPCFWGNMAFSKSIAIILIARLLNVTHIVESGRMGAISLTHYHHFGFNLTSVEFKPLEHVQLDLERHFPAIRLLNGDGSALVPQAIDEILVSDPAARVMAIIDGPKGQAAVRLAQKVSSKTVAMVLDDQDACILRDSTRSRPPAGPWAGSAPPQAARKAENSHPSGGRRGVWAGRGLAFYTLASLWLAALPRARDYELSPKHDRSKEKKRKVTPDRQYFFGPGATVVFGEKWRDGA